MRRFTCEGFRAVEAYGPEEAAEIFAERQARRDYGRAGYCRLVRLDCWAESGRYHNYECFIGTTVKGEPNTTAGRNIWLTVYAE